MCNPISNIPDYNTCFQSAHRDKITHELTNDIQNVGAWRAMPSEAREQLKHL